MRITGINASTVSRTLSTLVDAGYVEYLPETGRYRLGTHLLELSTMCWPGSICAGSLAAIWWSWARRPARR